MFPQMGSIEVISPDEVKKSASTIKNRKAARPFEIPLWKNTGGNGIIWLKIYLKIH